MKVYIASSSTVVRVHLESQLMQASKVGSVSTTSTKATPSATVAAATVPPE